MSEIQVDAWGAYVPGRGNLVDELINGTIDEVKKRNLPKLDIQQGELTISKGALDKVFGAGDAREYLCFIQDLGKSAKATLALRIAPRGSIDLELSWRLFESNATRQALLGLSQAGTIYLGIGLVGAGLLTSIFGYGLCAVPIGIYMIGIGVGWWKNSNQESQLTPEQKFDARALVQTVNYCLMSQLEKLGVSSEEVRTLQASQMEGIGKL